MASPVATTNFPAEAVPKAPEDPLFGLMAAYRADTSPDKVDLVGRHPLPIMTSSLLMEPEPTNIVFLGNWSVSRQQCKAVGFASSQEGEQYI